MTGDTEGVKKGFLTKHDKADLEWEKGINKKKRKKITDNRKRRKAKAKSYNM
jgi:hypothetical protein